MIAAHRIVGGDFATLAAGGGSAATISRLRDGQYSLVVLRIGAMLEAAGDAEAPRRRELRRALDVLHQAQERSPGAVTEVLLYPQVGAWAGHCLRRMRHHGHLSAVAAAAAIRAGIDFEIEVPAAGGGVYLPSLGSAVTEGGRSAMVRGGPSGAEVVTSAGAVPVPPDEPDAAGRWRELCRLRVTAEGKVLEVVIDDLDPWRDCHGLGASERLTAAEIARWHELLGAAWELLVRDHWNFAEGIAAGLTCLVPLAAGSGGRGMSATSADAFGSCSLSPPADPVSLAATLVHEFGHAKLSALHNLIALHKSSQEACYYSPWRDDPRPLWGLMHGAYAFLGVTDFWRRRRQLSPGDAFADFEFARWREQTRRALTVIAASGRLTAAGERLVAGMMAHTDGWQDPVPAVPQTLARRAVSDHEISWQLRNTRLDPAAVERLATWWLDGAQPPALEVYATVPPSGRALQDNARLDLTQLSLRDPARFAAACSAGRYAGPDIAYVRGSFAGSAQGYREQIMTDPGGAQSWAGFALALAGSGSGLGDPALKVLADRPALVAAVYRAAWVRGGGQRGPEELAAWLAGVTVRHGVGGSMSKS